MKLTKFDPTKIPYPYMVQFEGSEAGITTTVEEAEKWADDVGIDCLIYPRGSYFATEEDAIMFILKYQ